MTSPHPAMTAALDVVARLQERPYRTNFVLLGEPGTGKAGLARALHQLVCPDGPLVRFNVVGFTDDDALAVLAGDGKRGGAAAAAAGGTLLIGETAGLGPRTQAALIRLLKTGRVDSEGDEPAREGRAGACARSRCPTTTCWAEVRAGRFRHDLYWRLARIVLKLPPLRERKQDIAPAAIWMGNRILRDAGLPNELVTTEELDRLPPRSRRTRSSSSVTRSRRWRSRSGRATCASWRPCWSGRCCSTARAVPWTARPSAPPADRARRRACSTSRRALRECQSRHRGLRRSLIRWRARNDVLRTLWSARLARERSSAPRAASLSAQSEAAPRTHCPD